MAIAKIREHVAAWFKTGIPPAKGTARNRYREPFPRDDERKPGLPWRMRGMTHDSLARLLLQGSGLCGTHRTAVPIPKIPMSTSKQIIEAPASDTSCTYETLGYVDAYDAVLNCDYAFVAYKETSRDNGAWRVRIKSSQTAGAVFEPDMIRTQARAAGAQGKPWFLWGYNFEPSAGDPRQIEFRVHVANGQATAIEMFVRLRKFDQSADDPKSVQFPWPA